VRKYFDSLKEEILGNELDQILASKIDADLLSTSSTTVVKKITNSLYLTKDKEVYDFYECSYDNIIVNLKITPSDITWYMYHGGECKWLYEITTQDEEKEFCIFSFHRSYLTQIYKSFYKTRIETLQKIEEIKTILDVQELNEENKEYCFTKFAEKYPILLPEFIPEFQQNIGNIFSVRRDPSVVGIQELPIEFENV